MNHVQSGARDELGEREVRAGAVAGGGVVVLAGIRLHLVDELAQRVRVDHRRVHRQHVGDVHQRRDRREVRLDVEGKLLVERGVDAVRGRGAEQQRVAVGLGLRHCVGGEVAAGAGAVVHHQLAVERLLHWRLEQPRHDVDARTGRETHEDGHRLRRPGLRQGVAGEEESGGQEAEEAAAEGRGHGPCPLRPKRNIK